MNGNKKKIQRWLTPKQCQFIDWINDNFKFGKCEMTIHASDPQRVIIKEIEKTFDGNLKKTLDNTAS